MRAHIKRNLILSRSSQSSDEVHVAITRHDFLKLHWHQVCGLQGDMSSQPGRRNPNRSSSSDGGIGDDALRQRALEDAAAASDEARLQHKLAVSRHCHRRHRLTMTPPPLHHRLRRLLPRGSSASPCSALGGVWVRWPWQGAMGWVGRHAKADGASRHPPQQHPHHLRLHHHTS